MMISRVAESCFWMMRYLERMESTARLLGTTHQFALDADLDGEQVWRPVAVVGGEAPAIVERLGETALADGELVEEDMTWCTDNAASIATCLNWARENSRQVRETISIEMWNLLNSHWLWMHNSGRELWEGDRSAFYRRCQETAQLFRGTSADTMLHEEAYHFMRLGMFLERAGQTARLVDVKYHAAGPTVRDGRESALDHATWAECLRSCCASEAFFKRRYELTGPRVASFLLFDNAFPRTVRFCLLRARDLLEKIVADPAPAEEPGRPTDGQAIGAGSRAALTALAEHLAEENAPREWIDRGLHDSLTELIGDLAAACDQVHHDFFEV